MSDIGILSDNESYYDILEKCVGYPEFFSLVL